MFSNENTGLADHEIGGLLNFFPSKTREKKSKQAIKIIKELLETSILMKIIINIININDAEPCYRCDSFIKYMSAGTLSYFIYYICTGTTSVKILPL